MSLHGTALKRSDWLGSRALGALPFLIVIVAVLLVSWDSIGRREIDDLDQAHHVMGGLFFADVLTDLPWRHPIRYVFDYYSQYPALGFVFWPPLLDFVEGLLILVLGFDLAVVRFAALLFGLTLAVTMYTTNRAFLGNWLSVLIVLLILTTPLVAWLYNSVLLEVPALAMAFLTILLYQRVVKRGHWNGAWEVCLVALAGAAAVHAKQTIIFLFPALLADLYVNHRHLLKCRKTWCAAGLLILLCLPLATFTLQYGYANLAQSFGDHGDIYTAHTKRAPRWSVAGWTYYLRVLAVLIHPVLVGLAALGLVAGFFRKSLLRDNVLWIGWIIGWYVLFSYFDNKDPRFACFAVAAVIILAGRLGAALSEGSQRLRFAVCCCFSVLLVFQTVTVAKMPPVVGFSGMDPIVRRLLLEDGQGNIAYFGNYRQMFVPFVRHYDSDRQTYVLQGDDIVEISPDLAAACRDYRVRWIFLDQPPSDKLCDPEIERQLGAETCFRFRRQETFGKPDFRVPLFIYEYVGPVAEQMKLVPLRSETLNIHVQ